MDQVQFFKGYLPQTLLSPFLNTLFHIIKDKCLVDMFSKLYCETGSKFTKLETIHKCPPDICLPRSYLFRNMDCKVELLLVLRIHHLSPTSWCHAITWWVCLSGPQDSVQWLQNICFLWPNHLFLKSYKNNPTITCAFSNTMKA